jgi:hypothetical protein
MEGIRIYGTIPVRLKEALDKKLEGGEYNMSQALSVALHQWLFPWEKVKTIDIIPSIPEVEQKDFRGIILPSNVDELKSKSDPEIQEAFSLMSARRLRPDIRSGAGAVERLRKAGINPMDVLHALRASRAGRDYDKTLEKYFPLLENN